MADSYTLHLLLDKSYYQACYDQSLPFNKNADLKKGLIVFLAALGFASFYVLENHYLGYFLFALIAIEFVAHRYQKAWWVARQRVNLNAGHEMQLDFNEQGITSTCRGKSKSVPWSEVDELIEVEKGALLAMKSGAKVYLPEDALNEELVGFINTNCSRKVS